MKWAATILFLLATAALVKVFLPGGESRTSPSKPAAHADAEPADRFYWTTPGIEPDTCIAAWLLTRLVTPGALAKVMDESDTGVAFDMPDASLGRQPGSSVSDVVMREHNLADPYADALASVARELELMPWTTNPDPFFNRVRAGLADALNLDLTDQECLDEALSFLDRVRTEWSEQKAAASAVAE